MAHHVLQTGNANSSHHIVHSVVSLLVDLLQGSSLSAGSDDTSVLLPSSSQVLHLSQSGDGHAMTTGDGVLQACSYARLLDENYARAWFDAHKQTSEFQSVYVLSTRLQESSYLQTISP
ncbi:hypothetical protein PAXRUDRAFT_36759 [Paxillus rubicundulus Ve08.2h10]|uniref:Uncharacterized protein n=1 Tax=Paxillus rubicundulus Ve08.2h10 TaxID=930991 RepID=A0A0D0DAT9_9AGAM|nr:hypothetical protein PAXRUDRAFT_36759 [Paxillus rubicundulus Ve08.2h10]